MKNAKTLCNFIYWASGAEPGASGAELGASGVCFPLEFHFSKMLMASDLELGASDVELGATDLDLTVEGSSFPKIQVLHCIVFARFPLLVLLHLS